VPKRWSQAVCLEMFFQAMTARQTRAVMLGGIVLNSCNLQL
jgi:hypothetical protein